jgi:hypothetical protein
LSPSCIMRFIAAIAAYLFENLTFRKQVSMFAP